MKNLSNILFIDIETVSTHKSLNEMNDDLKELWQKKCKYWIKEDENIIDASVELYVEKAGIYAEFAKVVCISVGIIDKNKNNKEIRLKSFFGDNEGLVIAEVELEHEKDSFEIPDWLGKEVTGDIKYYNSHLSKFPFKNWI